MTVWAAVWCVCPLLQSNVPSVDLVNNCANHAATRSLFLRGSWIRSSHRQLFLNWITARNCSEPPASRALARLIWWFSGMLQAVGRRRNQPVMSPVTLSAPCGTLQAFPPSLHRGGIRAGGGKRWGLNVKLCHRTAVGRFCFRSLATETLRVSSCSHRL